MRRTIYILSDGKLRKRNNTMMFVDTEGKKHYSPVENIDSIMVFGRISISNKLLELFTQKGTLVHFFNFYEYYVGTYYPREKYASGLVLLKQVEHYLDCTKRLHLARKFVEGALKNIIQNLKYYGERGADLGETERSIKGLLQRITPVNSIEQLMAIEGNARDIYYRSFDKIIKNDDFAFETRTRRPPENRLNALISLGNSLLYVTVLNEIYKTHLDPRIGYLHTTNRRHFTLSLDIAEIFKPILVDRLIFTVIHRKQIKKSDFREGSGGIILKKEALKLFTKEWENRLKTTVYHRNLKRKVSYRQLIRIENYKIIRHLIGDREYFPYVTRR